MGITLRLGQNSSAILNAESGYLQEINVLEVGDLPFHVLSSLNLHRSLILFTQQSTVVCFNLQL
jgi:hypothetical protein